MLSQVLFDLMLGLALMSVVSSMVSILSSAVQNYLLKASRGLGTMWLPVVFTLSVIFSRVSFS